VVDDRMVKSRWFDLQDPDDNEIYDDEKKKEKRQCCISVAWFID